MVWPFVDKKHRCSLPAGGSAGCDKAYWHCPECLRKWVWTPSGGWR